MSRDALWIVVAGTAIGSALAVLIVPSVVPDMASSLLGPAPKAYWYLSRASGVVAYLLLWGATVIGLLMPDRFARRRAAGPAVACLHQFVSLLGLAFVALHGTMLLGDRHVTLRLDQLLVSFASPYVPSWVGFGQAAGYIALLVAVSSWVQARISVHGWRLIHTASVALFVLIVAHGLGAGTDRQSPLMAAVYVVTCSVTVFLTVYRAVVTMLSCARRAPPLPAPVRIGPRSPGPQRATRPD